MSIFRALFSLLILSTASAGVVAQTFPGPALDAEYLEKQAAADEAFEAEEYSLAYSLYLNDLAPKGDKFAQHQVGMLLVEGLGTEANPSLGAAWLELATERGATNLRKIRNDVWKQLTPEQKSQARDALEELEATYGDCVIVERLAEADRRELDSLTGSRIKSSDMMPLSVIQGPSTNSADFNHDPIDQIRDLKVREDFLRDHCR